MTWLKRAAILYLILIFIGASIGHLQMESFESHHLELTLKKGFDAFGRNCLHLTLSAISNSLVTILPIVVSTLFLSAGIALIASGRNERIRFLLRSTLDLFSALPGFLIALALGVVLPGAHFTCYLAALLLVMPSTIRYFESLLLRLQSEDYILAADAMGARPLHIWVYHLFPALRDSLLTLFPFVVLRLVLIETSLSFLGLSLIPEHESWGRLIAQGKDYLIEAPWILATSAIPLCLMLASFHLLSHEDQN